MRKLKYGMTTVALLGFSATAHADVNEIATAQAVANFLATAETSQTECIRLLDTNTAEDGRSTAAFFLGRFGGREVVGTISFQKLDSGAWRASGGSLASGGFIKPQRRWITYDLD